MRTAAALVALAATATVASAHWPGAEHAAANARKRHSDIKRSSGYQLSGYYAGQDFLNLFDFATGQSSNGFGVIVCMSRSRARVASADRLEAIHLSIKLCVCVCVCADTAVADILALPDRLAERRARQLCRPGDGLEPRPH